MKFGISSKLFIAVLATAMFVALAMGGAAHLSLTHGFLGYLNEQGVQRLIQVLPGVTAGYRANGSWEFLRQRPDLWYRLLRPVPGEDTPWNEMQEARAYTVSDLTGAIRRFTLYDVERRRVAGFIGPTKDAVERRIIVDDRTVGWLAMAPFQNVTTGGAQRFAQGQLRASLVVGVVAVLLAAGIALWVARILLAPVKRVADATHKLAAGDYATRVRVSSHDEVGQLAVDFNLLAHTLERNEKMRREFMADLSHELRTPLGVLHGELEAMEDGVRVFDAGSVRSLQTEVTTLNKLVSDLYDLSLADVGALTYRKSDLDVNELLQLTASAFGARLAACAIVLELHMAPVPLIVFGDERRLQQLFNNLFENTCRYTDPGGTMRLEARVEARHVIIDVMDSAPGVSAEWLQRIFDRFFRIEESRNRATGGAGLGLAICRSIVEAHDGSIEAQASPMGGLWIRIRLPAARR
ncbi:MAG TPA: ATP-binding protein [Burkholderiales bacterium]|nr:ATP-binding protein [Burkholderiales bacterium]